MSDKKPKDTKTHLEGPDTNLSGKVRLVELGSQGQIRPAVPTEVTDVDFEAPAPDVQVNSTRLDIFDQLDDLHPKLDGLTSEKRALSASEAEVLRKYIELKEAESEDLRLSVHQFTEQLAKLTHDNGFVQEKLRETQRELESRRKSEERAQSELLIVKNQFEERLTTLKNDHEEKLHAFGNIERDILDLERRKEEWKTKVTEELRRVRLKEREFETKHELLRRDSQALLESKDRHLIEVQRKCDALELEMQSLEERLREQGQLLTEIEARKKRLLETLRLALALIESLDKK